MVAFRPFATVGILNDAMLIDPEKVDVQRSHVVEDAIQDRVADPGWFKSLTNPFLDVV
jgi:hypothetical protein